MIDLESAIALYNAMSEISEEEHFASWMDGTEFSLWERIKEFPHLEELSARCAGWIVWVENSQDKPKRSVQLPEADWLVHRGIGPHWVSLEYWLIRSGSIGRSVD